MIDIKDRTWGKRLPVIQPELPKTESSETDVKLNGVEAEKKADYFFYDENNKKIKKKVHMKFTEDISGKDGDADKLVFNYKWTVKLDGKVISNDKITEVRSKSISGTHRKEVVIYSDKYHYYSINYYIIKKSTQLDIRCGFIEYMKK